MKNSFVFACLLIGLQPSSMATAQFLLTIPPKQAEVIGVPSPPAIINTAAADSLRKRPFRYGVPAEWHKNHKEPLIVIDGKIDDSNILNTINPQDIDRVEVLKGVQATSIYGQRGVDGVIIILTKKQENNRPKEKGPPQLRRPLFFWY
jgi:TonB-dependent SusC/RagA subfamily outer membrane receptor